MSPDPTTLISRIESAWANTRYPGDSEIAIVGSYDFGLSDYFRGTSWTGHSFEKLRLYCFALTSFFTPQAYVYWLPAYLRAAVYNPNELSQGIDSLVDSVTPETVLASPILGQAARLKLLSAEQLTVVSDVIDHLARTFAPSDRSFTRQANAAVEYLRSLVAARATS